MATITPIAQGTTKKLTDDLNNNFNNLNTELTGLKQVIIDTIYPVDSFFISLNSTNPSTLFGGTWERIKGRFLYGIDTEAVGSTGGAKEVTLTTDQMPEHSHKIALTNLYLESGQTHILAATSGATSSTKDGYPVGGGQAHNNMPPYLGVYIWKRTA